MSLPPGVALVLAGGVVVVQRAAELALARRNEVWARAHGAVEHGAGHYPWIVALHAGWLVGWIGEAWFRGPVLSPWWPALVVAFLAAQVVRYWAIASLGRRWNTRILVLPGAPLVATGPYRYLRHPNYVGVVGELVGAALMAYAPLAGAVSVVVFGVLLVARIRVEERALMEHSGEQ